MTLTKARSLTLAIVCLFTLACSPQRPETKALGSAEWTSRNLNVTTFKNGDPIPEAKSDADWSRAADKGTPAWCFYENDATNTKLGRLYNWTAVNDPRGLAPAGWHIPTKAEWMEAEAHFSKGGDLFSWQHGGFRHLEGNFRMKGFVGYWWTATQTAPKVTAYSRQTSSKSEMPEEQNAGLGSGFSVRLVKD